MTEEEVEEERYSRADIRRYEGKIRTNQPSSPVITRRSLSIKGMSTAIPAMTSIDASIRDHDIEEGESQSSANVQPPSIQSLERSQLKGTTACQPSSRAPGTSAVTSEEEEASVRPSTEQHDTTSDYHNTRTIRGGSNNNSVFESANDPTLDRLRRGIDRQRREMAEQVKKNTYHAKTDLSLLAFCLFLAPILFFFASPSPFPSYRDKI